MDKKSVRPELFEGSNERILNIINLESVPLWFDRLTTNGLGVPIRDYDQNYSQIYFLSMS
jgi:hypothetical protein